MSENLSIRRSTISTSTPRRSDAGLSERDFISEDSTSISTVGVPDNEPEDFNEDVNFHEINGLEYLKGALWNAVKPVSDSLYSQIIKNYKNIEEIIEYRFFPEGKESMDFQRIIFDILQLFLDLSGFQKVKIENHYRPKTRNEKEVVDFLTSNPILLDDSLKIYKKNIWMTKNKCSTFLQHCVQNFITELLQKSFSYENTVFLRPAVSFLDELAKSRNCLTKSTGITVTLYFITALSKVRQSDTLQRHKAILNSFLPDLLSIIERNAFICIPRLVNIRVIAVNEFLKWFIISSIFFIDFKIVNYLTKYLQDAVPQIREKAATGLADILAVIDVEGFRKMKHCIPVLSHRRLDANDDVKLAVIKCYEIIFNRFNDEIDEKVRTDFTETLLQKPKIATAAAKVLLNCFRSFGDKVVVINKIVETAEIESVNQFKALIVEAFYTSSPELQDLNTIVKLLTLDAYKNKQILAELFAEIMFYLFHGVISFRRAQDPAPKINFDLENDKLLVLLKTLPDLFNTNLPSEDASSKLLKCLLLIDFSTIKGYEELEDLFSALTTKFYQSNDENCLELIVQGIENLCKEYPDINCQLHENFAFFIVENFNYLQHPINELDLIAEIVQEKNTADLMKLAILSDHHDLKSWSIHLNWSFIIDVNLKEINQVLLDTIFKLSKNILKWNLYSRYQTYTEEEIDFSVNKSEYERFIRYCLELFGNTKDFSFKFKLFCVISDMHIDFATFCNGRCTGSLSLSDLNIDNWEVTLTNFINQLLTSNTDRKTRQLCVIKALLLVQLGSFKTNVLPQIFQYYHAYYQEIGYLIEDFMDKLIQRNELDRVIITTLTNLYGIELNKSSRVDLKSSKFEDLQNLSQQFSSYKNMNGEIAWKIVQNGVKFAISKGESTFCTLLNCFFHHLPEAQARQMKRAMHELNKS